MSAVRSRQHPHFYHPATSHYIPCRLGAALKRCVYRAFQTQRISSRPLTAHRRLGYELGYLKATGVSHADRDSNSPRETEGEALQALRRKGPLNACCPHRRPSVALPISVRRKREAARARHIPGRAVEACTGKA